MPPDSQSTPSDRPPRWLGAKVILCGVVVVAVAAGVFFWMRNDSVDEPRPQRRRPSSEATFPDATADAWDELVKASPYHNVRPNVPYVSDAKCAECHGEIAESYARHPMGRSLAPMSKAESIERFTTEARHPFAVEGFVYEVRQEGDRQLHREKRLSPAGKEALTMEFEAVYAVGSGRTGRSYMIERDNHLFMSPLTWYADHGWDLSPGYEVNNSHFNRPVVAECLFCHSNRADHVDGTLNRYEPPIFSGHAIGCQRCHGPGEMHVVAQERGDTTGDRDLTIVNPALLTPGLRESVCQQCHLGGLVRVETRGRSVNDFRPGLPWSAVQAVFLAAGGSDEAAASDSAEHVDRFVGHVEQMHQSGCYIGSNGKLGCISCHDPHRLPEEKAKVEYFRKRCLQCHGETDCELPLAVRHERQAGDSCYACHMPHAATQIRHAAATDHRIPRSPAALRRTPTVEPTPSWSPLLAFESFVLPKGDANGRGGSKPAAGDGGLSAADHRNLGIALARAMDRHSDIVGQRYLPRAISLLEQAVERDPADIHARDAYAFVLARNQDLPAALRQMEEVVKRHPRRESALGAAAPMLMSMQQWASAGELWERAREVNPWIVRYWTELALCQARLGKWDACAATCEEAIKRFPDSFGARQLLVECRLVAGRTAEAEREFERMLELNPPKAESMRLWWDKHPLRQRGAVR